MSLSLNSFASLASLSLLKRWYLAASSLERISIKIKSNGIIIYDP